MARPELAPSTPALRRWLLGVLLGTLVLVCIAVLRPFVASILWALIVAYASWPAHHFVLRLCHQRCTLAALAMTMVVTVALIVPLLALTPLLQSVAARLSLDFA
jgi:predicted PurR-regulated permease PerM